MVRRLTTESRKLKESTPNLVKTTISAARKLFDKGETVYLLPNKVRLGNAWISPFAVNKNNTQGHSLENVLDSYSYYMCNKETGTGIAFYKEENI